MATKTTKTAEPLTAQQLAAAAQKRLDKANADIAAAEERLAELRQQQLADGNVTGEAFAEAVLELAGIDRQGAEADFAEARQAARMEKLAQIRADIEARADPAAAAAAFERAADAFANLLEVIGPERMALISEWGRQLMDLGIQPAPSFSGEPPAAEDDGFASRQVIGGGRVASIAFTTSLGERRVVRGTFDMPAILASLVDRACAKAHAPALLFEIGHGHQPLTENPGDWFKAHN